MELSDANYRIVTNYILLDILLAKSTSHLYEDMRDFTLFIYLT